MAILLCAVAEDIRTASASNAICMRAGLSPGVMAAPATAHSMMAKPMRSLNTE